MQKIKHIQPKAIQIIFTLSSALLLTLLIRPSYASAALSPGCYIQGPSGGYTEHDCVNSDTDPNTQCEITISSRSGPSTTTIKDCDTLSQPTQSDGGTSGGTDTNPGSANLNCTSGGSSDICSPISPGGETSTSTGTDGKQCGRGESAVVLSISIGCRGDDWPGVDSVNPIIDMVLAVVRFLSLGVGVVVVGSIIWAGIQYSTSRGDPQAVSASINRVTNSFIALLLYIFIFAIANFLVPGGMFI